MTAYIIRRTLLMIPVVIVVSLITFILMHLAPGSPFDATEGRLQSPAMQASMNKAFGLDKPEWQQYLVYMGNVIHFDFGPSLKQRSQTVTDIFKERFPFSIRLGLFALVFAVVVGLGLGILAALHQNSWIDYLSLFIATLGIAIPSFVLSLFLILLFAVHFGLTPVAPTREQYLSDLGVWVLPTIALGLPSAALLARLTRTAMLEVLQQDYIRTARSKGLRERVIIQRHIIKNAMIPVWTTIGPLTAGLITGSFIVESIFSIPGIGGFFVTSISARDYSMIMGTTIVYSLTIVIFNLLTDITYGLFDPRIKVSK
ncbi:MAG: ABC transporter permease [Chloroflexia bacterium]